MHRITIQYAVPDDPETFDRRYAEEHVPLALALPGLRDFTLSRPRPLGGDAVVHLVAELDFDDAAAMKAALRSEQMAAAGQHATSLGVPATMFSGEVVSQVG